MLGELFMIISIFLPNTITSHKDDFLLSVAVSLNDIRHAGDWLLVERQSFHLFVAEVSNRPGEVQPIDSSLDDGNPSLRDPLSLNGVLWLMVE